MVSLIYISTAIIKAKVSLVFCIIIVDMDIILRAGSKFNVGISIGSLQGNTTSRVREVFVIINDINFKKYTIRSGLSLPRSLKL